MSFWTGPVGVVLPKSTQASPGPQFVQGNFTQGDQAAVANNPGNAYEFGLTEPLGAGNILILKVPYDTTGGVSVSSISDTVNGSWSTTAAATCVGANKTTKVYLFPNSASGAAPTFTVNFSGNVQGPEFSIQEWSGIATSNPANGSSNAPDQTFGGSTPIQCGSFTPTVNNDNNGGNVILSFFDCSTGNTAAGNVTTFTPSSGFTLNSADIGWTSGTSGLSKASAYQIQATQAAVNPGMTPTGDTADTFNCVALALKGSLGAGTPPSTQMRISKFSFEFTNAQPASWVLQMPCVGNLRVIVAIGVNSSVTDSEGNTWTFVQADNSNPLLSAVASIWYMSNTSANPNLKVTCHGGTGTNGHCALYDISNAPTSNNVGANTWNASGISTATGTSAHAPDITPTKANSIVIIGAPDGLGPVLAITSPTGAVSDMVQFTGNGDSDTYSSGDAFAHFRVTAGLVGVSQNVTWTVAPNASDVFPHAVEFLSP